MDDHIPQLTEAQLAEGYDTHEPNTTAIAFFGILCIFLLVTIIVYIQYHWDTLRQDQIYKMVEAPQSVSLGELRANEDKDLLPNQKPYIDRAQGKVKIGIDRAMELVSQEAAQGKTFYPAQAYAVKPLETAPAPGSTPNAGTNAAPAQAGGAAAGAAGAPAAAAKPGEPAAPAAK